jgi:hypothetical protein
MSTDALAVADRKSDGIATIANPGRGRSLPLLIRKRWEAHLGVRLDGVRIHDDSDADSAARGLGALAFTLGSDVYFRSGAYSVEHPSGRRLLAHEIAHVLQSALTMQSDGPVRVGRADAPEEDQAEAVAVSVPAEMPSPAAASNPDREADGTRRPGGAAKSSAPFARVIRRYEDPTQLCYASGLAEQMTDADVLAAIGDLRRALAGAGPEALTTPALWSNLDLLLTQVRARRLSVGENQVPRTATRPGDLASPRQISALDVYYEVLDALAKRRLGTQAETVRARIAQRRAWLSALNRDAVIEEGALVEALQVALASWQQASQIVPARPTGDMRIAGAEQNLRLALDFGASTLLSTAQQDGVAALELARTDYLSTFARLLLSTANDLKTQLRDRHLRDIPMVSNYEEGINTRTAGGQWEGADDLRVYRASLDSLVAALDAHGDVAAKARSGPGERLAYLIEHGDQLMDEIGQVQALIVAGHGIALVAFFQDATSSQLQAFDWIRINDMRQEIIEPMVSALRRGQAPTPAALDEAQFHLEIAAPSPTDREGNPDQAAVAEQQRRHRARRETQGRSGDEPEDLTRRRLRQIAEFNDDFGLFAGVAMSIIGAVAAAGAVGALMRTAAFSEGGALAAGQGLHIGAIRFVAQSLTFTLASQTMQAALHGKLPVPSDVVKAAAMDAGTLGFMHVIGLPFTRVGQQPPTAVQFGALWAWSSAWQIGSLAWRSQLTLESATKVVALGGAETALMLKSMEVAHRIGMLPTPDGIGNWFRPKGVEQSAALQEYLAAQGDGRAVRRDAMLWQKGVRAPEPRSLPALHGALPGRPRGHARKQPAGGARDWPDHPAGRRSGRRGPEPS